MAIGYELKNSLTFNYDSRGLSYLLVVFIQLPIFVIGTGLVTWLIYMLGIHIVDTWMELVLQVLVCTNATPLIRIICFYD